MGFELTMLVVIGTDCIGGCKSNYHTKHDHKYYLHKLGGYYQLHLLFRGLQEVRTGEKEE